MHPTHQKRRRIIQIEMPRILLNPKTIARHSQQRQSVHPSVHYRRLIGENLCPKKTQVIGNNGIGSLGKIRTSNPSVNSHGVKNHKSWFSRRLGLLRAPIFSFKCSDVVPNYSHESTKWKSGVSSQSRTLTSYINFSEAGAGGTKWHSDQDCPRRQKVIAEGHSANATLEEEHNAPKTCAQAGRTSSAVAAGGARSSARHVSWNDGCCV